MINILIEKGDDLVIQLRKYFTARLKTASENISISVEEGSVNFLASFTANPLFKSILTENSFSARVISTEEEFNELDSNDNVALRYMLGLDAFSEIRLELVKEIELGLTAETDYLITKFLSKDKWVLLVLDKGLNDTSVADLVSMINFYEIQGTKILATSDNKRLLQEFSQFLPKNAVIFHPETNFDFIKAITILDEAYSNNKEFSRLNNFLTKK